MRAGMIAAITAMLVVSGSLAHAAQRHGDWTVGSETDPIDDRVSPFARTEGDDASIIVICRDGQRLELLVVFDHEYIDGPENVIFRVDRNEPFQESLPVRFSGSWSRVTLELNPWVGSSRAEQIPQRIVDEAVARAGLVAEAMAGTRLAIRTYDATGLEVTKLFSLSGFTAATRSVFQQCSYDPNPEAIASPFRLAREAARKAEKAAQAAREAAREAQYARVDTTLGEEYRVIATLIGRNTTARLYTQPGDYDDYIEDFPLEPGTEIQVLRRFRTWNNDQWTSFWYLVQIPNGPIAWMNPGGLRAPGGLIAGTGRRP